jgi:hypothetical protein
MHLYVMVSQNESRLGVTFALKPYQAGFLLPGAWSSP